MASHTFTHVYDTHDEAEAAITRLEAAGIPHGDITLVGNDYGNRFGAPGANSIAGAPTTAAAEPMTTTATPVAPATETAAGTGASVGTIIGGGAGLLAGIGALAIPGVGPVVAAGWLVATLTGAGVGAGAGGLLGSLTGHGVPEQDAHVAAEGVRRGGSLVSVRADSSEAVRIEELLVDTGSMSLADRRTAYEGEGWKGYEATAPGYTAEEVEAERARRNTRAL